MRYMFSVYQESYGGLRANVSIFTVTKHFSLLMRLNGVGWILIVVLYHEIKPFDTN